MISGKCPICGEYPWFSMSQHECKPLWFVWAYDYDDLEELLDKPKSHKVRAYREYDTVEKYCYQQDSEFPDDIILYVISEDELDKICDEFYDLEADKTYLERLEKALISNSKKFAVESEIVRSWNVYEE